MSRYARTLRIALHCLPVALACAGSAHAAPSQDNTVPRADFDSCTKPQYPHADVQAGHQGTVSLGFLVDETGQVKDSKVVDSSGFATLDEAAREAIAKCRFQPALENGKPVQKWAKVQYMWTLR